MYIKQDSYQKRKFVLYLIGILILKHLNINIRILIMHLIIQQNISISQHQLVVLSKLKDTIERMELMLSHIQEELLLGENNKLNI